jgi:hypothetical protein
LFGNHNASALWEPIRKKYTRVFSRKLEEICQERELWRGRTPRGCRFGFISYDLKLYHLYFGMNALKWNDRIVFCSSEEKRIWK